jgi:hypothetical protein
MEDNSLPPRVGLYRVIFRRYAWYFTIIQVTSVHYVSGNSIPRHLVRIFQSFAGLGKGVERTLRTEEFAGDVEGLASNNDNLLSVEQLLSHSTGQPTKEVTLAIDSDLLHRRVTSAMLFQTLRLPHCDYPSRLKISQLSVVDRKVEAKAMMRTTYDWLEGRHFVLLHAQMRRRISKGLSVPLPSIRWRRFVVMSLESS